MTTFLNRGLWLGFLGVALQAGAATQQQAQQLTTFRQIIEAGGVTMEFIIALSVLATFLVIFFLFSLRAGVLYPRSFLQEAEDAAAEGDLEAFRALCESNSSTAARILEAAAEQMEASGSVEYSVVRDALEDEGARQASLLWQRIQYLLDIAVVAPMLGLLGTVIGMLQSFSGLQLQVGSVIPQTLAKGVAKALITTAGGRIVGMAAMILYALFRGRLNKLIGNLEAACGRVLRQLISATSGSKARG